MGENKYLLKYENKNGELFEKSFASLTDAIKQCLYNSSEANIINPRVVNIFGKEVFIPRKLK